MEEVTAGQLRKRAAYYRERMARTADPRAIARYGETSALLNDAAEAIEADVTPPISRAA